MGQHYKAALNMQLLVGDRPERPAAVDTTKKPTQGLELICSVLTSYSHWPDSRGQTGRLDKLITTVRVALFISARLDDDIIRSQQTVESTCDCRPPLL